MSSSSLSSLTSSSTTAKTIEKISFRYIWPVRVVQRQLNHNEAIILHISPKFATVFDHVAFQWTIKMHGSASLDSDESADFQDPDYIAVSLYYVDGPISAVDVYAHVDISTSKDSSPPGSAALLPTLPTKSRPIHSTRGRETEILHSNRQSLTNYIKERIGKIVRLSVILEMDANLFKTDKYLNAVSPTPVHSFLTANYRARVRSKVWRKKSKHSQRKPRSEKSQQKFDLEKAFNEVMDRERNRLDSTTKSDSDDDDCSDAASSTSTTVVKPRQIPVVKIFAPHHECCSSSHNSSSNGQEKPAEHLFKKLLVACCDSCERRASLIPGGSSNDELDTEDENHTECDESEHDADADDDEAENAFECMEENKAEMHDTLANMYFNKVALPQMEYVEDFADFLIDAELNDLPVLKRACERYLCGELNGKKDLLTSLLLDLLFLAMLFQLPVMKSMTLTELIERYDELRDINELLKQDEYQKLDKRVRQMSDRNLNDLVDECKKFREQQKRVEIINLPL